MRAVYLDHAATSPVHPEVIKTMAEIEETFFGNPSSIHRFGREARKQIEHARATIAESIGAKDNEIVFTSGGTEADNLAIIGTAFTRFQKRGHIVTTAIEHHAVLKACEFLETLGFEVTYVPVENDGIVRVDEIQSAIRKDTFLVSVMLANNEVGTIQPVQEIASLLKDTPILLHTDAVQAYGIMPIDVNELGVDLLSASAHKLNGPKGIGFLYVKEGVHISPLLYGGAQEKKRRAGTENVPAIVGFQKAVQISESTRQSRRTEYESFRNTMLELFEASGIDYLVNGHESQRLPHILNVSFPKTTAEALLVSLDLAGVAASSGSACTAGALQPSHVLQAMFPDDFERVKSAIRFSFGYGNTLEDIKKAARETIQAVERITRR